MKVSIPRYQQIAADIATKIALGEYKEGDKIYVRSALASQYGVSAETARRAICVLADMKILQASKGSGVLIISRKRAEDFIKKFDSISEMSELKKNILQVLELQTRQNGELKDMFSELLFKTERYHSDNPFAPFKIEITKETPYIEKNLSECNFWHNTLATVTGILRNGEMIISPGPYAMFLEGDIFYFVGADGCNERVKNFLYA